jgi:lauroyl/myristoyl acyltransferase
MMDWSDASRLKLHPLRIAPFGDGNYSVIRRGGREEIATRGLGVEALHRLGAGDSLGEARRWLAERHGTPPESIRLEPLLRSLSNAGLIAEVDGEKLVSPRIGMRDYLRFQLRFELMPRLAQSTRRLPIALARPALRKLYGRELRVPCARKVSRAGANFEQVFPRVGARERQAFERQYFDHLVWNVVDLEVLRDRPFEQVEEWLESFVRLEGIEVLDQARRQNRGVMLVGFHFSANRLLPIALMRRGYSLTSMGAISLGWGSRKTKERIAEWRRRRPSYGGLELVDNLDLGSVNRLVGELRRGGTVLTMPDVYSLSTFENAAVTERSRFFGVVRSRFRPAVMPVPFFDHSIDVNPWGGWLAATAQPVVLPVLMERRARQLVCRFGEPFDPAASGGGSPKELVGSVTRKLFETLELEVASHPAQWFGWHNLDKLNPVSRENQVSSGAVKPLVQITLEKGGENHES